MFRKFNVSQNHKNTGGAENVNWREDLHNKQIELKYILDKIKKGNGW